MGDTQPHTMTAMLITPGRNESLVRVTVLTDWPGAAPQTLLMYTRG
jgi:hypothetical protein